MRELRFSLMLLLEFTGFLPLLPNQGNAVIEQCQRVLELLNGVDDYGNGARKPPVVEDEKPCGSELREFTGIALRLKIQRDYLSETLGMELLKEEIKRIKKGMGLDVAVESAMDRSATEKNRSLKVQGLDLNNPFIDHEQQWSKPPLHHDERQEATTNKTASFFLDRPPRPEKVPIDLNLRANRRTMMDFKRRPLTQPTWVNNRRSWTPELHTRFVVVLHMLGGPEAATPKQIRDLMQVDGLTNNQVKSHLQKYRSYWRTYPDAIADDLQKLKSYLGDVAEPNGTASGIAPGNID